MRERVEAPFLGAAEAKRILVVPLPTDNTKHSGDSLVLKDESSLVQAWV